MKNALVTGACRGIGLGVARALAASGFNIAAVGTREESSYSEALSELRSYGTDIVYIRGDISLEKDRAAVMDTFTGRFGSLDLLVNNAGVAPSVRQDMLDITEADLDRLLDINLKGTYFMSVSAAKLMIKQGMNGKIINMSSVSAYATSVERAEYCISKAGISMCTALFAHRLSEYGINVYEIRPGIIKTDMTSCVTAKYDKLIDDGITPIKRWGYPEDIGKAVAAIAGGAFDFSTGEVFNIDGGFHLRRF